MILTDYSAILRSQNFENQNDYGNSTMYKVYKYILFLQFIIESNNIYSIEYFTILFIESLLSTFHTQILISLISGHQ